MTSFRHIAPLSTQSGFQLWDSKMQMKERTCESSGKSGELLGNLWIALNIHSERSSWEVARELLGKFGEILGLGSRGSFQKGWRSVSSSQRQATCVSKQRAGRDVAMHPSWTQRALQSNNSFLGSSFFV